MTFFGNEAWWWPFVFILVAGWLATDSWRFLGVLLGERIAEDSPAMVLVRAIATALVAAVNANMIVFPGGALAATPLALRLGAALIGFGAYLFVWRHLLVGIVVAEVVLVAGILLQIGL